MPATMRNVPSTMTNTLQHTMSIQRLDPSLLRCQLSNSHMQPIGWKHMSVPSKAPIRDTSESKTGIALAMIYAITVTVSVQPNQVHQWTQVLLVRCREPRRRVRKTYLAGSCARQARGDWLAALDAVQGWKGRNIRG